MSKALARVVFLSELIIDVEESKPTNEPLFAIRRDVLQVNAGRLVLVNEGWTQIERLKLHFNILPGLKPVTSSPPYRHSIDAGPLLDRLEVEVDDAFTRDGLDLVNLLPLLNVEWLSRELCELPEVDGKKSDLQESN
jgi:hypothetical protein